MAKDTSSSVPLLNSDDDPTPTSTPFRSSHDGVSPSLQAYSRPAESRSFPSHPEKHPRSRSRSQPLIRRLFSNKQILVGLVLLILVIAFGVPALMSGDHAWNGPSAGGSASGSGGSGSGVGSSKGWFSGNKQKMTQEQWQALEGSQYDKSKYVLGPPTQKFRDNLRKDVKYMAGWIAGGWTNDFMTYINLIYMAVITGHRVPIIGQFNPTHVGRDAGYLHFAEVFDIPRLSRLIRTPILEWRDVKNESSEEVDEIGCWSAWAISGDSGEPRHSWIPEILNFDISYTTAPKEAKMTEYAWDWFVLVWPLAALAFPQGRAAALEHSTTFPSPRNNVTLLPDEQLVCYDFLYFTGVYKQDEWFEDYSPAWREVGTYTHWAPHIDDLTDGYLMRHFGVKRKEDIPLFITIHVRRSDFEGWCGDVAIADCFAPIKDYARRVREIQDDLVKAGKKNVTRVMMTSDERDAGWWKSVSEQGWTWVDHVGEKTTEKYGKWYPVLIDAVIQSRGQGFVGTDRSTMSMVAERRVQDWNDGPTRNVKWGFPGADDH